MTFKEAFNTARNAAQKYFEYKGNTYNTINKGESINDWLKTMTNMGNGNQSDINKANANFGMMTVNPNGNPTYDWQQPIQDQVANSVPTLSWTPSIPTPEPIDSSKSKLDTLPTSITTFNRKQIRQQLRNSGVDPYTYSGGQRKALRNYINNGGDINEWIKNNPAPQISYNQQGGELSNQKQIMNVFKQWVIQKVQNGEISEEDLQDQNKLKQLFQIFQQEYSKGVQTAMNGAKLKFINQLNGKCPQGTHLSYYKVGGTLCKKCEADNEDKNPIKAFKDKCGGKMKKKEFGGELDDKNKNPKLIKKPQNKPNQNKSKQNNSNKPKPTLPTNNRPGPKDLKTLPNGKYPKYWTPEQRGQWDRDHDEGV